MEVKSWSHNYANQVASLVSTALNSEDKSNDVLDSELMLVTYLVQAATEEKLVDLFDSAPTFNEHLSLSDTFIVLGDKSRSTSFKARFLLEYLKNQNLDKSDSLMALAQIIKFKTFDSDDLKLRLKVRTYSEEECNDANKKTSNAEEV